MVTLSKLQSSYRKYFRRIRHSLAYITNHPLTKNNCLSAYSRYIAFHIIQMLHRNCPKTYPFIGDIKYYAKIGESGIVGNLYTGLDDFEEMFFLLHFLRRNDTFIDVGANVGAYSLLASGVCQSKSIAIEPIPETFKRLKENIRLNVLDHRVDCLNVGLGAKETNLNFIETPYSVMNRVAVLNECSEDHLVSIKVFPLDAIVSNEMMPSLIKLDVEGFEMEVLRGASRCLNDSRLKALIIELNHSGEKYGYTDEQILTTLYEKGFAPCRYEPFTRNLELISGKDTGKFNTLFIRNYDVISKRVTMAPKIKVLSHWV